MNAEGRRLVAARTRAARWWNWFGLTNHEGNHGEDVKEDDFYLDGTPTRSYMRLIEIVAFATPDKRERRKTGEGERRT